MTTTFTASLVASVSHSLGDMPATPNAWETPCRFSTHLASNRSRHQSRSTFAVPTQRSTPESVNRSSAAVIGGVMVGVRPSTPVCGNLPHFPASIRRAHLVAIVVFSGPDRDGVRPLLVQVGPAELVVDR